MSGSNSFLNNKIALSELEDMDIYSFIPDNPYLLLTPGPLSTSKGVRAAMLFDLCTRDSQYKELTQKIRSKLVCMATENPEKYTAVLMQGSGTFCVEAVLGSVISKYCRVLILSNGAYGKRMKKINQVLKLDYSVNIAPEDQPPDTTLLEKTLYKNPGITHVAFVHCETTT